MESILNVPIVAAVGAPAVAVGGITLFFLKVHYQKNNDSALPPSKFC